MRCACIDIGSNTTRLLVADCDAGRLVPVCQERAFTRLGATMREDGAIPAEKLTEVVAVVRGQLGRALGSGAASVRCVATAAVRRAGNGGELVARVAEGCDGLRVEVLSGEDEARLAFLGATHGLSENAALPVGVADVGGGSTELVVGTPPNRVVWWISRELGSSELAAAWSGADPPAAEDLRSGREHASRMLAGIEPPHVERALAVGGSATSLLRLAGPILDPPALRRALGLLAEHPAAVVAGRFGLDVERVRLLPAGLLILEAASVCLRAPLVIGGGGIREGVLLEAAS